MHVQHHAHGEHSLSVYTLNASAENGEATCSMNSGLDFVSVLRSRDIRFEEHVGPLSLKCAVGGDEHYAVDGKRYTVDSRSYLVLNEGQSYASFIEHCRPIESFCVWFRPGFEAEVYSALSLTAEAQLDEPDSATQRPALAFLHGTFPHNPRVLSGLLRLRRGLRDGWMDDPLMEEMFHFLLEAMLEAHRNLRREIGRVPALKASTREELYRRLLRSRDYLDSAITARVTLPELAGVAGLSTHYFLRLFQQVFGETPRGYQSRIRMERARRLLATTEIPITEICFEVGFESLGSFSWDFRRRFGESPSEFRRAHRGKFGKKAS